MKTIFAIATLALSGFAASANATTYAYVKPAPVSCVGDYCTVQAKLTTPVAPIGGSGPTATPFNASLVMAQASAVAKASAACFYANNEVPSAEALAVTSSMNFLCLSSTPTPQAAAIDGNYSWAIPQMYDPRGLTAVFQVRNVNAQTGVATYSAVTVSVPSQLTLYRSLGKKMIETNGVDAYIDSVTYDAYTYTSMLSGASAEACAAVAAAGSGTVSCSGGVITASYSVGTVMTYSDFGGVRSPSGLDWFGTVAYPN